MSQQNVWIVDHKDSFTYNLVELVRKAGDACIRVMGNEEAVFLLGREPVDRIILSPGPGVVTDASHAATYALLEKLPSHIPVLGVCLGHQIIGVFSGASLEQVKAPLHGVQEKLYQEKSNQEPVFLYEGLPHSFDVGLYHSWRLSSKGLPECLSVTARDEAGSILSIQHREKNWHGIQFHPESILTPQGLPVMRNFLSLTGCRSFFPRD